MNNDGHWLSNPRQSYEDWEPPPGLGGTSFAKRRTFFERNKRHRNRFAACPACGYPTLRHRNSYDSCPLCHWEDDGQDDPWADQPNGGPNDSSLTQARRNFEKTYSVWGLEEQGDFSAENRNRIYSPTARKEKEQRNSCASFTILL